MADVFDYYTFAKNFGWTPAQVEDIEDATLRELSIVIQEVAREEMRQMKKK